MFYAESQGPWNGSCSLKVLEQGGFMGHPVSFNWYDLAKEMGDKPVVPEHTISIDDRAKASQGVGPLRCGLSLHSNGEINFWIHG